MGPFLSCPIPSLTFMLACSSLQAAELWLPKRQAEDAADSAGSWVAQAKVRPCFHPCPNDKAAHGKAPAALQCRVRPQTPANTLLASTIPQEVYVSLKKAAEDKPWLYIVYTIGVGAVVALLVSVFTSVRLATAVLGAAAVPQPRCLFPVPPPASLPPFRTLPGRETRRSRRCSSRARKRGRASSSARGGRGGTGPACRRGG